MATAAGSNGRTKALTLAPYFDIQLRFAKRLTALGVMPFDKALTHYTNLHRRFAYGNIGKLGIHPDWSKFVEGLALQDSDNSRLEFTVDWYASCTPEKPLSAEFGCFNFDPPNAEGMVRIHFNPLDIRNNTGPLHHTKLADRQLELRTMVAHIRANHPTAQRLRGISWLYNLDAYRRIFPPEYATSGQVPRTGIRYEGMSSWGQFLDHRGGVKHAPIAEFLASLEALDVEVFDIDALWRVFPLPALRAEASLDVFDT